MVTPLDRRSATQSFAVTRTSKTCTSDDLSHCLPQSTGTAPFVPLACRTIIAVRSVTFDERRSSIVRKAKPSEVRLCVFRRVFNVQPLSGYSSSTTLASRGNQLRERNKIRSADKTYRCVEGTLVPLVAFSAAMKGSACAHAVAIPFIYPDSPVPGTSRYRRCRPPLRPFFGRCSTTAWPLRGSHRIAQVEKPDILSSEPPEAGAQRRRFHREAADDRNGGCVPRRQVPLLVVVVEGRDQRRGNAPGRL